MDSSDLKKKQQLNEYSLYNQIDYIYGLILNFIFQI